MVQFTKATESKADDSESLIKALIVLQFMMEYEGFQMSLHCFRMTNCIYNLKKWIRDLLHCSSDVCWNRSKSTRKKKKKKPESDSLGFWYKEEYE